MAMPMLSDKVVIVTGAGSGIGKSTALAMAMEGASLVLADINSDSGGNTLAQVKDLGAEAIFVTTDVSDAAQVECMVERAMDYFSRLDCAFNNAGIEGVMLPLDEIEPADFDRTITVNLRSSFLCMKYEALAMKKSGGGSIVNMASVMGLVSAPNLAAYSASKFGIVGLTYTAALEFAEQGIRVNAVCPGVVDTPMFTNKAKAQPGVLDGVLSSIPAKRLASPEEVAQAAIWLCSGLSSFVTGVALPVDGAYRAQ